MACTYYINGKPLSEFEFKKILNDGLLDQIIAKENLTLPGFEINSDIVLNNAEDLETEVKRPITLKILRKIDKQINNVEEYEAFGEGDILLEKNRKRSEKNPREVIETANEQNRQFNKKNKTNRPNIELLFAVPVADQIETGNRKDILNDINNSVVNIKGNLTKKSSEGHVYMLIPSAYGLFPVRLKSNFLGQTKIANNIRESIEKLFTLKGKEFTKETENILPYIFKPNITEKDGKILAQYSVGDQEIKSGVFDNAEDLSKFLIGEYDSNGNLIGKEKGAIAFVNSNMINSKHDWIDKNIGVNEFYSNNNFVTTDLYSEGGNFFNSTSFILEGYKPGNQVKEILKSTLEEDIKDKKEVEKALEDGYIKNEVNNQDTRKDEIPINEKSLKQVEELKTAEISYLGNPVKVTFKLKDNSIEIDKFEGKFNKEELEELRKLANPILEKLIKEFGAKNPLASNWNEYGDLSDADSEIDPETKTRLEDIDPELIKKEGDQLEINFDNTEKDYINATTWDKEKTVSWFKDKLGKEAVDRLKVFNSIEDLKEYLPEESYEMLIEARKNGKFLHGLFTKAAVHIANNAFEGTGFHEAFHVVFDLALNVEQRLAILAEAVEKYNLSPELPLSGSNSIEEVLADQFMDYVRKDGEQSLPDSKIARFFKSLWRSIKLFFNKDSKISIDELFSNIQLGVYKNKIDFVNTDISKINPDDIKTALRDQEGKIIDPIFQQNAFEYLEHRLFNEIDKLRDETDEEGNQINLNLSDSEIINKYSSGQTAEKLFANLIRLVASDRKYIIEKLKLKATNHEILLNYLTNDLKAVEKKTINGKTFLFYKSPGDIPAIALKFSRYLRHRGISNFHLSSINSYKYDLAETTLDKDKENSTVIERWQQGNAEINPVQTMSQEIRRKLGTIKKVITVDGKPKIVKNIFGTPVYYSEKEVFGFLGENITDSSDTVDMKNKLEALKNKKPFIKGILDLMEADPGFTTKLYNSLGGKTFKKYLINYEQDGEYYITNSNKKTPRDLIKEKLISNFIVENNKLFKTYEEKGPLKGQRNFKEINIQEVYSQKEKLENIQSSAIEVINSQSLEKAEEIIKDLSEFLSNNNLPISEEQLTVIWNPSENFESVKWKNIIKIINNVENIFKQLENEKNPFLERSNKKYLENLIKTLEPALSKEYNASIINTEGKPIYSIQYSNYLNRLISKFKTKEGVEEYYQKVKKDPLLSNMPFTNDLLEEGNVTGNMENLEINIFEALSRKTKYKSIPYKRLTDIEKETTNMSLFYNSNGKYGNFMLPTPADSTVIPTIKAKKYNFKELVEKFVQIAKAEQQKIRKFNNLPEDSKLLKIPNYKDKAGKYNILSFLEGKANSNTTEEDFRNFIIEFLEGDFLNIQFKKYEKEGIIQFDNKKIIFDQNKKIIDKRIDNKEEFFKNYLWNSYYMNTQMTTIFAGDPAYYKNTIDYQKRYKQIISPGTYTDSNVYNPNTDKVAINNYKGLIFKDETTTTDFNILKNIKELIDNSNLNDIKKKELKARWDATIDPENTKNHHNITDAATFISVDRYLDILASSGTITEAHNKAAERIKKGKESIEDIALFNPIKPFMYTTHNIEGNIVPIQIKNSEVLLTKAFAYRKDNEGNFMYPKLIKVYDLLNNPKNKEDKIDFIAFESAVKVGGIGSFLNEEGEVEFNSLELNENTKNYDLVGDPSYITLNQIDWKNQQENPEHYIDESGNFGSQLRVLAISDMDMDGDYNIGGKNLKGREVAKLYQDLIVKNIINSYEEVEKIFLTEEGDIDYPSLTRFLQKEILKRNLSDDFYQALELKEVIKNGEKVKEPIIPLWHPIISRKIESLMSSIFTNKVIKQKFKGGQMVNATSYGVSDTLKFEIDKDGNYKMQALLPWWSKRFFPKDKDGNVNIDSLPKELKNLIGYRIPTEDKYSIFNIEVVGFTDSASGGQIILPPNATTQAGLDFDIDKLFMMMPEYTINNKGEAVYKKYLDENSSLEDVVNNIVDSNQLFNNFLDTLPDTIEEDIRKKEEIEKLRIETKERVFKAISAKKEFKESEGFINTSSRINELKAERKVVESKEKIDTSKLKAINSELTDLYEEVMVLDLYKYKIEEAKESKFLKEEIKNYLEKIKLKPSMYKEYNNTASRNNKILEIMTGIMENKHTALSILDFGNFDNLREQSNKVRLLSIPKNSNTELLKIKKEAKNIINKFRAEKIDALQYREELKKLTDQLDDFDFNINYPSTQLTLFRNNMSGLDLTGIMANHVSNHAKAQYTSLNLRKSVTFDKKEYKQLNQSEVDGVRISDVLGSFLAAAVDNAKDPISSYYNLNTNTADLVAMLIRLGVPLDTTIAFINQPSIIKITNLIFSENLIGKEAENAIKEAIKEMSLKVPANFQKQMESLAKYKKPIPLSLKELEDALDGNEQNYYFNTQLKALHAFKNYSLASNALKGFVQTSRVDTRKFGPSLGDNFVNIFKQINLLNPEAGLEYSPIQGMEDFFENTSDLKINPAFNRYALIKPNNIFNKIFHSIGNIETTTSITRNKFSILGDLKRSISNLNPNYDLSDTEANNIDEFFKFYIASQLPFFSYGVKGENAKKILKKVPENLRRYKNKNLDSVHMPFLDSLNVINATKDIPINRIEYVNIGKDELLDIERAQTSWEQMLFSDDIETRELGFDLIKYSFFVNGFSFNSQSFFNLIPVEFWKDSFANLDQNKNKGLIDDKGNTNIDIISRAIEASEDINIEGLNNGINIEIFVRQFIQNFNTSSIIPEHKEKIERKYTQKIYNLNENQVYGFATTQEGQHNIGSAAYAFNAESSFNTNASKKGQKGKWAEYGSTGEITKGNEGSGFGLRMQKAIIENNKIKDIVGINDLEGSDKTKLLENFRSDLKNLIKTAINSPNLEFLIDNLTSLKTKKDINTIRQEITKIYKNFGIPNNIILPKIIDPRPEKGFDTKRIGKNEILFVDKEEQIEKYRKYIRIKNEDNNEIKLFERIDTKEQLLLRDLFSEKQFYLYEENKIKVAYKRINTLGISKYIKEFNYNQDITDSVLNFLTEKTTFDSPNKFKGGDLNISDVLYETRKEQLNAILKEKEDRLKEVSDNTTTTNLGLENTKETVSSKDINYKNYSELEKSLFNVPISINDWNNYSLNEQIGIMEYLKTCK